jgi:hypothetical protein
MTPSRLVTTGSIVLVALVVAACSSNSPTDSDPDDSIEVDLSRFPDTGDPVPDGTVLTDQWASIGILFDAAPDSLDGNPGTAASDIVFRY